MEPSSLTTQSKRGGAISRCIFSICLAALLLAGMIGFLKTSATTRAAALTPATTDFRVGIYTDVLTLDPANASDSISWLVAAQIYDTLTFQPPDGSFPEPALAISWTVSSDGLTWTFTLQPGVTFHDGTPLDAQAVVTNFERWWDPSDPYHQGDFDYFGLMFNGFKGDPECLLLSVSAPSSDQVQLVLSSPRYTLPGILSIPPFSMASPSAIQAGTLLTQPVGSGAFKFNEHVPYDTIKLDSVADYWGGAPQIQTLTFQVIPDDAARFAALQAGSLNSVGDLPNDFAMQAAADPALQVQWRGTVTLGYMGMNRSHTPLDDLLVRQAIAHAIDLPALIEQTYPFHELPASQFLPPGIWGGDPDLSGYSYEPALSVSLLNAAGYTDGFSTTLAYRDVYRAYSPDPGATAEAISAYLNAVGIDAEVIRYESGEFINKLYAGELELFMLGWMADYLHPDNFFSPILCDPDMQSLGPLDATLCNLVQLASAEPDFADQLPIYQAASRRVYDNVPLLPLVHARDALIMGYEVVGVTASPNRLEAYKDASFPGAEQVVVEPETDTSLVFVGTDATTTSLEIPAGAVSETILLRLVVTEPGSSPPAYASAGYNIELDATLDGDILAGFTFQEPVTFTIDYPAEAVADLQEATLLLFYWDGSQWLDAATTCDPVSPYMRDPENHRISVQVCHLTPFGLFAEPYRHLYLPLVGQEITP